MEPFDPYFGVVPRERGKAAEHLINQESRRFSAAYRKPLLGCLGVMGVLLILFTVLVWIFLRPSLGRSRATLLYPSELRFSPSVSGDRTQEPPTWSRLKNS